jgi:hypothetical protein
LISAALVSALDVMPWRVEVEGEVIGPDRRVDCRADSWR